MEATLVVIAAGIGVVLSLLATADAFHGRRLVRNNSVHDEALLRVANQEVLEELGRLFVQVAFFTAAIVSVFEVEIIRTFSIWLLVAVPITLAAWSGWALWQRRKLLL